MPENPFLLAVLASLVVAEILLIVELRRSRREIRGLRDHITTLAVAAATFASLMRAVSVFRHER